MRKPQRDAEEGEREKRLRQHRKKHDHSESITPWQCRR
jgi:hypothetical protein